MGWCLFFTAISVFLASSNAQFFFNQPQQPFNFFNPQPFRPFQNLFQPPTTTTPQPTTPVFIPDPDKEQGNFPMPNPANWPVGPDWNDPRNNQDQQLGWGGNGLVGTTSANPSVVTTTVAATPTTTLPPATTVATRAAPAAPVTKKPVPSPNKKQPNRKRASPKRPLPTQAPIKPRPAAPLRRGNSRRIAAAANKRRSH